MNREIQELLCKKCSEILYEKKGICEICCEFTVIRRNQKTQQRICRNCQRIGKKPRKQTIPAKKECSLCHGIKRIALRLADGGCACHNCRIKHSLRRTRPFRPGRLSPA